DYYCSAWDSGLSAYIF
nr:immunoglobulin light chain junction region [Macaca mulatta]MOX76658.1 immunoglobulin light chain junction region [Macaca mulatta]